MKVIHVVDEEFCAYEHPDGIDNGDSWLVANGEWSDAVIGGVADGLVRNTKRGRYMVHLRIELERIGDLD